MASVGKMRTTVPNPVRILSINDLSWQLLFCHRSGNEAILSEK
jgi:hypothetical protein